MRAKKHLYVHVPFCSGKCAYCAFYSVPYDAAWGDRFLGGVECELTHGRQCGAFDACETLYIGGGTPSILSDDQWARLLDLLTPVTSAGIAEWTVEINPGTVTAETLQRMRAAGVNRVSMGVQSFDDDVLQSMQRRHTVGDVAATLDRVRGAGITNVGLDLIAGWPGVDADGWQATLGAAIALEPSHVSVYALGIEAGSVLAQRVRCGDATVPDDTAVLAALDQARDALEHAGYQRYEISNYARPGSECMHNLACWRGGDYIGLGPAASSRSGLKRWTHKSDLAAYCHALEAGGNPPAETEQVSPRTDLVERLVFGLRLSEGVAIAARCTAAGPMGDALWTDWSPTLERLEDEGFLMRSGSRWKTTRRGCDVLDAVIERLVD